MLAPAPWVGTPVGSHSSLPKIDLIPAERAQLSDAQPVAIGDPDHGSIRGQAFAGAALGLGTGRGGTSHFEGLAWWFGPWCCPSHADSTTRLTVPFWVQNGTV